MGDSGDAGGNTQPRHSDNLRNLASRPDDSHVENPSEDKASDKKRPPPPNDPKSTKRRGTGSKKGPNGAISANKNFPIAPARSHYYLNGVLGERSTDDDASSLEEQINASPLEKQINAYVNDNAQANPSEKIDNAQANPSDKNDNAQANPSDKNDNAQANPSEKIDNAQANPSDKNEVEKFMENAKLIDENAFVPEVLESLKVKEFKSTKKRMEFCVKVLKQLSSDSYPETEDFATQLETFLDSFGYFPPSLRNSYRSWLEQYPQFDPTKLDQVSLEEISTTKQAKQGQKYKLLESMKAKAEAEGNIEMKTAMEIAMESVMESIANEKKMDIIANMIHVLGTLSTNIANTWSDLKALSIFGDDVGGGSTTETGPTAQFMAQGVEHLGHRGGCLPVVDDLKCDDYDLLSKQGGWIVKKFNNLGTKNDLTREEKSTKNDLTPEEKAELKSIGSLFDNWLANAKVSAKSGKALKLEMNKVIKFLDSEAAIKSLESKASNSFVEKLFQKKIKCPPMQAQEVEASQPAMVWLLNRISGIAENIDSAETEENEKRAYSPSKKGQANVQLPKAENGSRKKCIVDIVMNKPGQIQLAMLDNALRLPVGVKPLLRQNQGPTSLESECKHQIVGHLSKYIRQFFNHHAVGMSSYATGVVSTLAYVKVLQFHLIMDFANEHGDGASKLIFSESKYLPLISKSTFETWIRNHGNRLTEKQKKKLGKLKAKLYKIDDDKEDHGGIPPGILALYELARQPRDSFFGPKFSEIYQRVQTPERPVQAVSDSELRILNNVLGYGSFGVVLGAEKGKTKYAVKTGCLSLDHHIQNERNVLNELGQNRESGSPNEFLSILEKELELNLKLGSYQKKVPALLLSPSGIPLLSYLSSRVQPNLLSRVELKTALLYCATSVLDNVGKALEHVHQCGYLHNDISPKNMIVVSPQEEDRRIKICLVDFGGASKSGISKYPFGTTSFMHEELLNMDSYSGKGLRRKESHDWFGLHLSCAAILHPEHPGHPSWDMTHWKDELNWVLRDRRDNATAILDAYASEQVENGVLEVLREKIRIGEQL